MWRRKVKTTNLARLIALNPPDPQSREFVLAKDQLSIGSDQQNDIVVRHPTVSRRHAMLKRRRGNRWEITDLGSTNGTTVNGAQIKTPTEIHFGDELAIGGMSLALVGASAATGSVAGITKPAPRRIASMRTVLEVGLIFFVVGFGAAQYLAFLKYREENRFMLAQAEAIPAEQLAQRAQLAARQPAPAPPPASSAKPSAPPVVANAPATASASASGNSSGNRNVPAASSSATSSTMTIPPAAPHANLPPANPPPAMTASNNAGAETNVGVTLAQWFRSSDPRVGTMAPDFDLSDTSGRRISLSSLRGKVVLIDTWATWCHVCRSSMPDFESFYRDFRNSPKFVILTVSQDRDLSALRRFVDSNHYDFPVLIDPTGQFGAAYDITAVPSEILIGSNGKILWYCPGGPNWSDTQIRTEFRKLL